MSYWVTFKVMGRLDGDADFSYFRSICKGDPYWINFLTLARSSSRFFSEGTTYLGMTVLRFGSL